MREGELRACYGPPGTHEAGRHALGYVHTAPHTLMRTRAACAVRWEVELGTITGPLVVLVFRTAVNYAAPGHAWGCFGLARGPPEQPQMGVGCPAKI